MRSAMHADSQLPGQEPTHVDDAPAAGAAADDERLERITEIGGNHALVRVSEC